MDLTYTDEQQAISDLSHRILSEQLPPERLRQLEQAADAGGPWFADDVWRALAQADLLGLSLPVAEGGGGYGLLEACLVAEQVGRSVAPVPYLSSIVGGALPVAEHGDEQQRRRYLPGVIDGSLTLTIAVEADVDAATDGEGWALSGTASFVVGADRAAAILVPGRTAEGCTTVFLVAPTAEGVSLTRERTVTGEPQWTVELARVAVGADDVLGAVDGGADVMDWTTDRLRAAICAMQTGVCEEALAITARYVCEREQFGTKLGTFQAVGHRIADAYIDTEAIRLTALQAAWRLDRGLPAADELMVAKFWAAEGAQRVVHAAQHLHGGIGVDLDYPIHRYFRWAKVLELTLGGASPSLLRLGASLARQPVASA
jgi:alkylation response protein AidB-like acyl-CoA dehydrogenase